MGKHSEKRKGLNGKKVIGVIVLLVIIVTVIIGIIYISKKEDTDITSTENGPTISYYNEKNKLKVKIEDNSIINKKVSIVFDKGTAKVSKDGGKYIKYNGEILEDGIYKVKVEAEDKTATVVSFEIDTTPPLVEGIVDSAGYNTTKTIALNMDDVKILTIKRDEQEIATKENFSKNGKVTYELIENGRYKIYVEDYNGNYMEYIVYIWKE